jgi:hypothetical protein
MVLRGRIQQFGNTKVEQFGHTPGGNKNVRWFDVSMNYQVLVRVFHGGTNDKEQPEPVARGKTVVATIVVNGQSVHILHDEVRNFVTGHPYIQQAGNIGVIQVAQDLPLRI